MVVYDCNHGTWEAKAEGSGAQADPQLHRGLEAIVGHTRFCTIERKKNKIGKKKITEVRTARGLFTVTAA